MIASLVTLVIYLIIIGLIFYVIWWALGQVPLPEPFGTIARVLVVLIAVLICVTLLLQMVPGGGFPKLTFR
mgnify:CR=1 FL=1